MNVLLVEDNDFTRSTVAASLRAEGCDVVTTVSSAREAMRAASQIAFDCAVVDLHLGMGPTGIDVAHALRKVNPAIGIVILTTYEDPRLLSADQRALPARAVYAVKNDIHTTGQLRDLLDVACSSRDRPLGMPAGRIALTDPQAEILRLVSLGLTNAEIARRRVVTERSVETALARIVKRLGIEPETGENSRVLLVQAYNAMTGGAGGH